MRVLCFGAHMDDVEPQMGGTIARLSDLGHEVIIVIASFPNGDAHVRLSEAKKAAQELGVALHVMDILPDRLRHTRALVSRYDDVISNYSPDRVYTCWDGDTHQDHHAVSSLVKAATRRNATALYHYQPIIPCGLTDRPFVGNTFVDISDTIERKLASVRAYASQLARYSGWIEAIQGRDAYHGFRVGVRYAEVFQVIRELEDF